MFSLSFYHHRSTFSSSRLRLRKFVTFFSNKIIRFNETSRTGVQFCNVQSALHQNQQPGSLNILSSKVGEQYLNTEPCELTVDLHHGLSCPKVQVQR